MSIFGSQEKKENSEDKFTFPLSSNTNSHHSFISDDLEINGNITGKDYIDFNGKITGTLRSNKIDIRENGIVNGEIHAENVICAGEVDGEIKADDLYIRSTAKIKGVIKYKNIDIQAGAIITAELIKTI
ncbi:MAG: bactofilin family protein [Alphaproteobacteria bacterium]|tara:strand:- start:2122 stop:2508 length:387 start_codon:yes stop_codon:yes gene_type:complete